MSLERSRIVQSIVFAADSHTSRVFSDTGVAGWVYSSFRHVSCWLVGEGRQKKGKERNGVDAGCAGTIIEEAAATFGNI
jgi:hypothetical protein